MALSSLRFPLLSSPWLLLKTPKLPSFKFSILPLPLTQTPISSSYSTSPVTSSPDLTSPNPEKWETFCKKKVVLRVGYVGSDYRGLQKQQDDHYLSTIEEELEQAIFKAGGIKESNFGKLHKVAWARSSRTDKGVHSLATMITMKMEIPENAWKEDPCGALTLEESVISGSTHISYLLKLLGSEATSLRLKLIIIFLTSIIY